MSRPLVTAEQMREMDRITIEELGIPGGVLMEVAGRGAAELVAELSPSPVGWRVAVVCGAGNNGGDGYVVARHLAHWGAEVTLVLLAPEDRIQGDARVNYDIVRRMDLPVQWITEEPLPADLPERFGYFDCLVDAMLGTGLSSEVRGRYRPVIEAMNASGVLTVAVDIPSGLSADTGQPLGVCVRADATATFGCAKVGLETHPGVEHCGQVRVVDIGIPPELSARLGVRCHRLEQGDVLPRLPGRRLGGHKGTFGHTLCVAGSVGKSGAAVLGALGAARVGSGLVTVAAPADVQDVIAAHRPEIMTERYAAGTGPEGFDPGDVMERIARLLGNKSALMMGPGIPTHDAMAMVLRDLLGEVAVPTVLDADALNLLARNPIALKNASAPVVITPHPGEMARLLGSTVPEVQADRIEAARRAAAELDVLVALKGARTVIATPQGEAFVNPTGNPGMGSGGVGDVLTGMVAGLLAQGLEPLAALQLAVCAHGEAGDRAADRVGQHALLAGDLLDALGPMLAEWSTAGELYRA